MAARLRPTLDEPRTRLKQVSLYTPTRVAILDAIRAAPGCTVTHVARVIGRDQSTISTNVRLLREAGVVSPERFGPRLALFLTGEHGPHERLSARVGGSGPLLAAVQAGGGSVPELARRIGWTRNAVRYHLRRLSRAGLVRAVAVRVLVTRTRYIAKDQR